MTDSPSPKPSDKTASDQFKDLAASKLESANTATTPERSLWTGGYSPKAMYGSWVVAAVITIAALVGVAFLANGEASVWYIAGAILLVMWLAIIATYFIRRIGQHYELTTQRFIHQNGILVRRTDRIEVIDIEDVSYTQGIVQRMLGVGTIQVSGRDQSHPVLTLIGIDKVPEVASLIDDVRRAERRKRSIHLDNV
jgi:uncharacterized membrane protein YdbT with pleckstrin-like domain